MDLAGLWASGASSLSSAEGRPGSHHHVPVGGGPRGLRLDQPLTPPLLLLQGCSKVLWASELGSGLKLLRGETSTYFSVVFEPEEIVGR